VANQSIADLVGKSHRFGRVDGQEFLIGSQTNPDIGQRVRIIPSSRRSGFRDPKLHFR
jgi:hypothetical protein